MVGAVDIHSCVRYGDSTLDVRVCASPGRDKTVEEKKKRGVVSLGPDEGAPDR